MPDAYTPPGSANSYSVPADLDAVDVATWFEDFADTVDTAVALKLDVAPTQSVKTVDATFALADATGGKSIIADKATAIVFTIPPQASVTWGSNAELHWFNKNDGLLTIAPGAGVTFIGTALTFAKGTGGKAVRTASNEWVVLPFSAGSARATVTGTTGSPTTTTPSGRTAYEFTGSGTFTTGTAGTVEALVLAGGGGGGGEGGGGAGGYIRTILTLAAGTTYTVTVAAGGAGGAQGSTGSDTICGPLVARGGGGGRINQAGLTGGSGGGSGYAADPTAGGAAIGQQGNAGGAHVGAVQAGAGGGGAGAAGAASSGSTPGAGGAGVTDSITGSAVARAGGGGGANASAGASATAGGGAGSTSTGTNGTANTGGGGGGGWAVAGGNGGSGTVIILVG